MSITNINTFSINYLKQFSASHFLTGQQAQRQQFDAAAAGLFSGSTLAETLSNGLADGRITAPTSVSELKSGNIIFWEDNNNETQVGIILPDLARALHLNPAVTDYESLSLNGLNLKGRVVVQGWISENAPGIINPAVAINYDTSINTARAVQADSQTGQLSGIIILQQDTDINWASTSFANLNEYATSFRQNIVNFWENINIPLSQFPIPRVNNTGIRVLTRASFLSDFISPINSLNLLNEVDFFVNSDPTNTITTSDLQSSFCTDRIVLITVGNGASSDGPVSYVARGAISTGYMFSLNNASEAAHEFGHLCGLADRYAESVVYDDSFSLAPDNSFRNLPPQNAAANFQRGLADAFIREHSSYLDDIYYTTPPINPYNILTNNGTRIPAIQPNRQTFPIVFNEVGYDYLTNLMSRSQPNGGTLTETQLQIVYNNTGEITPFRVDLYVPISDLASFDGLQFVYNDTTGNNNLLRRLDFTNIVAWNQRTALSDAQGNNISLIRFNQWFKIHDPQDLLPNNLNTGTPNFLVARWTGALPVSNSSIIQAGVIGIDSFHKRSLTLTNGGIPITSSPTIYRFWSDDVHLSHLSGLPTSSLTTADIMSHAVRWMINNNLCTRL